MPQSVPPTRKSRALIADDQREVREALRLLLKAEGYETETAASASGASRNAFNSSKQSNASTPA